MIFVLKRSKAEPMKIFKILPIVATLLIISQMLWANDGRQAIYNYIDQFKEIAVAEMERTGVPASIKMAQAILESNAGRSDLAIKANNHFGIKCASDWKGRTYMKKDDDRDSRGRLIKSCFRNYSSPEESFIAHSDFLMGRSNRYGWLFELDPKDYKAWAKGLQKSGYATNRKYSSLLINVIENYELAELDQGGHPLVSRDRKRNSSRSTQGNEANNRSGSVQSGFFKSGSTPEIRREFEVNQLRVVKANQGETLADLALELDIPVRALLRWNDGVADGFQPFERDRNVFLQPKRRNYREGRDRHIVQEGETMLRISQKYGLKLHVLYKKNRMDEDKEPAVGEIIHIRGRRNRSNPIRYRPVEIYRGPVQKETIPEPKPQLESEAPIAHESPSQKVESEKEVGNPQAIEAGEKSTAKSPSSSNDNGVSKEDVSTQTHFNSSTSEKENSDSVQEHIVQAGDTLYAISKKYNLSVDKIRSLNGLDGNNLSIGQVLLIGE